MIFSGIFQMVVKICLKCLLIQGGLTELRNFLKKEMKIKQFIVFQKLFSCFTKQPYVTLDFVTIAKTIEVFEILDIDLIR